MQLRKDAGDLHRVGDEGLSALTKLALVGSKTHGQRGTHHLSLLCWQIVKHRRQTMAPQKVAGDLGGQKLFVELQGTATEKVSNARARSLPMKLLSSIYVCRR